MRNKFVVFIVGFIVCTQLLATDVHIQTPDGEKFPIGIYSVSYQDIDNVSQDGFDPLHEYTAMRNHSYIQRAALFNANIISVAGLDADYNMYIDGLANSQSQQQALKAQLISNLQPFVGYDNILWWSIEPEELSVHTADNRKYIEIVRQAVRQCDPLQRPVFMYQQAGRTKEEIKMIIDNGIDLVATGAYANWARRPRVWVRWRMDENNKSIAESGHLNDRWPVAFLQMFQVQPDRIPVTAEDVYHDFWASIIHKAQAIVVYSYYRYTIDCPPMDPDVYPMFKYCIQQVHGPDGLNDVIIYGNDVDLASFTVTSGPEMTEPFMTTPTTPDVQYPSIGLRMLEYQNDYYLMLINSNPQNVTIELNLNLDAANTWLAKPLFSDETANYSIQNGQMLLTFKTLEVKIFKIFTDNPADINKDSEINILDLMIMAKQWLRNN